MKADFIPPPNPPGAGGSAGSCQLRSRDPRGLHGRRPRAPRGAVARGRCPRPLPGDAGAFPPGPGRSMAEPSGPPLPASVSQPPPAVFFGAVAPGNPVVDSFEAELRDVLGFLRRLGGAGEAQPQQHDLHRRG